MPAPRKSNSQQTRTNSRKRLSSQTVEEQKNSDDSTKNDDENLNLSKNSDDPTNSSSNSPDSEVDSDKTEDKSEEETEEETEDKAKSTKVRKSAKDKNDAGDGTKRHGAEPEGHIVRLGEDMSIPATKHQNFAVVDQDVYREYQLRGSQRVAYQLVYTAGTAIPLNKLDQIK